MPEAYNGRGPNRDIANLRRIAYFAEVVEAGSFTAAAARLGITKAVVSQQVARLEQVFETTLLVRTTRSVRLTDEGRAFYERCTRVLSEAHDAFDALDTGGREPTGQLRLTAPVDYGVAMIVPAVAEFQRRYPRCTVDIIMSDRTIDPVASDVELAIRVGWLVDSGLRTRRIGTFGQRLVGSPDLVRGLPGDMGPEQLAATAFVANGNLRDPLGWIFRDAQGERRAVRFAASLAISATLGVLEAVRAGSGLAILPDFTIADDLACGRLVPVLPDWRLEGGGIHAVMPATPFRPARVTAFLDILSERERRRAQGEPAGG